MATLGTAYVQILPSVKGFKGELQGPLEKETNESAQQVGASMGKKLVSAAAKVITVAKIGETLSKAFQLGADYEQLTGGVEKIFGKSSGTIMKYAQDAYKTSGVSANKYMEQVTSFSASLVSAMGGNTKGAAEKANTAIVDMSDNASIYGSNITDIQNAYQGFAKQNYTMLDNLKLGYGGSASEMVRLIKDSGVLGKEADSLTAKNLNQKVSFDQIIDAIHKTQEKMHISGNTSKEAAHTVSGSVDMMKAAWENFLTSMGSGEGVERSTNALIKSIITAAKNVIPMVGKIAKDIPKAIESAILEYHPELQPYIDKVNEIVGGVISKIGDALKFIKDHLTELSPIIAGVVAAFAAFETIKGIKAVIDGINGIKTAFGLLTAAMAANPFAVVVIAIAGLVAAFITLYKTNEDFRSAVNTIWNAIKDTVTGIWNGLKSTAETIFGAIKTTIETIWNGIKTATSTIWGLIKTAVSVPVKAIQAIIDGISSIKVLAIFESIKNGIKTKIEFAKSIVNGAISKIQSIIDSVSSSRIFQIFESIKNGIKNKIDAAKSAVSTAIKKAQSILNAVSASGILNIFSDIKSGIKDKMDAAKDAVKKAINKIKGFFDFSWSLPDLEVPHVFIQGHFSLNPPSVPHFYVKWYKKAMMQPYLLNGATIFGASGGNLLGGGEAGKEVIMGQNYLSKMLKEAAGTNNGANYNIVINVTAPEGMDVRRLAEEVESRLDQKLKREKAVFA